MCPVPIPHRPACTGVLLHLVRLAGAPGQPWPGEYIYRVVSERVGCRMASQVTVADKFKAPFHKVTVGQLYQADKVG